MLWHVCEVRGQLAGAGSLSFICNVQFAAPTWLWYCIPVIPAPLETGQEELGSLLASQSNQSVNSSFCEGTLPQKIIR